MKKYLLIILLLCGFHPSSAQELFRTQFFPYSLRADAEKFKASKHTPLINFEPTKVDEITYTQTLDIPLQWMICKVYIHLETVGAAYSLYVNDREVVYQRDPLTPRDYEVSEFLRDGENTFSIRLHPDEKRTLAEGVSGWYLSNAEPLSNCYIFAERKRRILDYKLRISRDEKRQAKAQIEVIVENANSSQEPLDVGYDIYDPSGELLDYGLKKLSLEGNSLDTLQFIVPIEDNKRFRWSDKNPALYRVTIYTRTNGVIRSYVTQRVGFTDYSYKNGELYNFGEKVELHPTSFGARENASKTREHLRQLKLSGINTLTFLYPQPLWLYEMADEMGFYVVEQASINTPTAGADRTLGGTPSNDPLMLDDYLGRVKASYSRVQNRSCVIAFSLGGASGVGYNIYKSYLWLKSKEELRPVFYRWAEGEWCSDTFKL